MEVNNFSLDNSSLISSSNSEHAFVNILSLQKILDKDKGGDCLQLSQEGRFYHSHLGGKGFWGKVRSILFRLTGWLSSHEKEINQKTLEYVNGFLKEAFGQNAVISTKKPGYPLERRRASQTIHNAIRTTTDEKIIYAFNRNQLKILLHTSQNTSDNFSELQNAFLYSSPTDDQIINAICKALPSIDLGKNLYERSYFLDIINSESSFIDNFWNHLSPESKTYYTPTGENTSQPSFEPEESPQWKPYLEAIFQSIKKDSSWVGEAILKKGITRGIENPVRQKIDPEVRDEESFNAWLAKNPADQVAKDLIRKFQPNT